MIDKTAALARLGNIRPPSFSAQMTTTTRSGGAAQAAKASMRIDYADAHRWKAVDGDKVSLRDGARAWTIWPDRAFVQAGEHAVPPFALLLWSTYRSNAYHVDDVREVELEDGRPGYAMDVSYRSGETTARWELRVDRDSGLVRSRTSASAAPMDELRLDAVDHAPAFIDRTFEAVIPPTAQVIDESRGGPAKARRLLIAIVARAALWWTRFRHPERL